MNDLHPVGFHNRSALLTLLNPRSVAVVGATPRETTAAHRVLRNLKQFGFSGPIYPVNPRYEEVLGLRCYSSLSALPECPDAAFIALPAEQVQDVLEEAARCGVTGVIANGNGFADRGVEGAERQRRLAEAANSAGMALNGPNNSGFVNVHDRTCLWTARILPNLSPGPIAAITQSGSISIVLAEHERGLGFAYIITAGNEAVCTAADYLDVVIRDERVQVVALFLETIRNPDLFASAAATAADLGKRIVVLKVGRSDRGRAAVESHTGAIAGDDAIYDAFFRRFGIIRVDDLDEFVETIMLAAYHPVPPIKRTVAAITCSGGEAGLIADLGMRARIPFADFSSQTLAQIRASLPSDAQPRNPLDVWGMGWSAERFEQILQAILHDANSGVLSCSIDAAYSVGIDVAGSKEMAVACVKAVAASSKKIVFYNNAAGRLNPDIRAILEKERIPYLSGMRAALSAIGHWLRLELPVLPPPPRDGSKQYPCPHTLSETAKIDLLKAAGISMVPCTSVSSACEAVQAATAIGFPVVLKGTAPDILHKTELGLVKLNLESVEAVEQAYDALLPPLAQYSQAGDLAEIVVQPMVEDGVQLFIGARNTPFGSVIVVGLGGTLVEILRDVSLRIGPVDHTVALRMLQETRAATLLAGTRGQGSFDMDAAVESIIAISKLAYRARTCFSAIEINPLIVHPTGRGAIGVDVIIETFDQPDSADHVG